MIYKSIKINIFLILTFICCFTDCCKAEESAQSLKFPFNVSVSTEDAAGFIPDEILTEFKDYESYRLPQESREQLQNEGMFITVEKSGYVIMGIRTLPHRHVGLTERHRCELEYILDGWDYVGVMDERQHHKLPVVLLGPGNQVFIKYCEAGEKIPVQSSRSGAAPAFEFFPVLNQEAIFSQLPTRSQKFLVTSQVERLLQGGQFDDLEKYIIIAARTGATFRNGELVTEQVFEQVCTASLCIDKTVNARYEKLLQWQRASKKPEIVELILIRFGLKHSFSGTTSTFHDLGKVEPEDSVDADELWDKLVALRNSVRELEVSESLEAQRVYAQIALENPESDEDYKRIEILVDLALKANPNFMKPVQEMGILYGHGIKTRPFLLRDAVQRLSEKHGEKIVGWAVIPFLTTLKQSTFEYTRIDQEIALKSLRQLCDRNPKSLEHYYNLLLAAYYAGNQEEAYFAATELKERAWYPYINEPDMRLQHRNEQLSYESLRNQVLNSQRKESPQSGHTIISAFKGDVHQVCFTPDSKIIGVISDEGLFRTFLVDTGKLISEFNCHKQFSGIPLKVVWFDRANQRQVRRQRGAKRKGPTTPLEGWIIHLSNKKVIAVDVDLKRGIELLQLNSIAIAIDYNAKNDSLSILTPDAQHHIISFPHMEHQVQELGGYRLERGHLTPDSIVGLCRSYIGQPRNPDILIWEKETGEQIKEIVLKGPSFGWESAYCHDSNQLLISRSSSRFEIVDVASGEITNDIEMPREYNLQQKVIAVSPDLKYFVSAGFAFNDRMANGKLIEIAAPDKVFLLELINAKIDELVWSPNGDLLVVVCDDRSVRILEVQELLANQRKLSHE